MNKMTEVMVVGLSCLTWGCGFDFGADDDPSASPPDAELPAICPEAAKHVFDREEGRNYCLFDDMELPDSDGVERYCHWLRDGYIGFHWPIEDVAADYTCPAGSWLSTNEDDLAFCIFDIAPLPESDTLEQYCGDLHKGIIGYSWEEPAGGPPEIDPDGPPSGAPPSDAPLGGKKNDKGCFDPK